LYVPPRQCCPREPAAARQREPNGEADHGDGGVLAARERRHQRHRAPTVPFRVEGGGGRDDQRDREGRGVDVAHVDALERGIDQVEQREGGRGRIPHASPRIREHGETAGTQDHRLRDEQRERPRHDPLERREKVQDQAEVIAPHVHLVGRHVRRDLRQHRAVPVSDVPHDLHELAEVEGVRAERQVASDNDEAHQDKVDGDAHGHGAAGVDARQHDRRHERADGDHDGRGHEEVLRAGEREPSHLHASRHDDAEGGGRQGQRRDVERADDAHGRRESRPRRLLS
jgi:hypothetical protein